MKAMILAAGLGTRLRPLTDTRPKALVEINGRTLLEITLARLRSFGINEVIINVHHFADAVVDYLKSSNNFGMHIEISREEDLPLDTGGGLKKASWFFLENARHSPLATRHSEPFLLHNVDVLSNIDFHRMLQFHNERDALATLAVQSRASSRLLLFNDQLQLVGRASGTGTPAYAPATSAAPNPSPTASEPAEIPSFVIPNEVRDPGPVSPPLETKGNTVISNEARNLTSHSESSSSHSPLATRHSPLPLAFSGIHIISPRLLPMLTETGVFSIVDACLRLAARGEKILAFRADEYYWRDLGRPSDLSQASRDLHQGAFCLDPG